MFYPGPTTSRITIEMEGLPQTYKEKVFLLGLICVPIDAVYEMNEISLLWKNLYFVFIIAWISVYNKNKKL